jgi:hypothetical protein
MAEPYHFARRTVTGRWVVCHQLPGQPGAFAADLECKDQAAAQHAADQLNAERLQRARAVLEHIRNVGPVAGHHLSERQR